MSIKLSSLQTRDKGESCSGTTTICTIDTSYNSQKHDKSYTENWYKNETGHFVQNTFGTELKWTDLQNRSQTTELLAFRAVTANMYGA